MTPASAPAVRRELEPTHPCIRCGREGVPADAGLCEYCNPLELSQPSATQMHGIAAVGILGFILLLALLAGATMAGTGPFSGAITGVNPVAGGVEVTIRVVNEGRAATATTCQVRKANPGRDTTVDVVQTPRIPAGEALTFTTFLTRFGTAPVDLVATCGSR